MIWKEKEAKSKKEKNSGEPDVRDKEEKLKKEIQEKVNAAPDDKLPNKEYRDLVKKKLPNLNLRELDIMKKNLQSVGIIETVSM